MMRLKEALEVVEASTSSLLKTLNSLENLGRLPDNWPDLDIGNSSGNPFVDKVVATYSEL